MLDTKKKNNDVLEIAGSKFFGTWNDNEHYYDSLNGMEYVYTHTFIVPLKIKLSHDDIIKLNDEIDDAFDDGLIKLNEKNLIDMYTEYYDDCDDDDEYEEPYETIQYDCVKVKNNYLIIYFYSGKIVY